MVILVKSRNERNSKFGEGFHRSLEAGQRMTGGIHDTAEASQREGSRTGVRQLQTFYQGG